MLERLSFSSADYLAPDFPNVFLVDHFFWVKVQFHSFDFQAGGNKPFRVTFGAGYSFGT